MGQKFTNFATSFLIGVVSPGDTSFQVNVGTGALYPSLAGGDFFYAVLTDSLFNPTKHEVVQVTARVGDTFTVVVRGQDGTSAQTWSAGDIVSHRWVAASIAALIVPSVSSFNTRIGAVTLLSGDVTAALGFTPYSTANPAGYISISSINLTGPITSVGNATSVASQTGTGSTFVMSVSPTMTGNSVFNSSIGTPISSTQSTAGSLIANLVSAVSIAGQSFGVQILAGTNSSDYALTVFPQSGGTAYATIFGNGLITYSVTVAKGSAPETIAGGAVISQTAPSECLKDGSVATPRTDATYNTPMIYVQRHTNNASITAVSDWSNARLTPAILAEVRAYGAEVGSPTGFAARVYSDVAAPAGSQPLLGFAVLAQSNAGGGNANRDCFAGNIIVSFPTGNKPANLVGLETDVIPSIDAGNGLPRVGPIDNFTAYWAQSASGVFKTYAGLFITSLNDTVGWQYGILCDAAIHTRLAYLNTVINDVNAKGLYVGIKFAGATGRVLECFSNGAEQLRVDGATDNPLSIMVNSTFRNVVAGAADSAGVGFRTLRVAN